MVTESTIPTITEMMQASGLFSTCLAPPPSRLMSTVSPMPAWVLSMAMKSSSVFSPSVTERLYHQQPAILVMRVADGGDDSTNDFRQDHDSTYV